MPYSLSGTLKTDMREVAIDETWDSQSEWENYQSANNVSLSSGVVTLAQVSVPSTVLYQHDAQTFSTGDATWADQVGSADMSLTGGPQSVSLGGGDGVEADGTDDYGLAPTQDIATNETFGIAFTFSLPSISTRKAFFGVSDDGNGANRITLFSGIDSTPGALELDLGDANASGDSSGRLRTSTDSTYDDGNVHAAVINKRGNTGADIEYYVDDMSATVSSTVQVDSGFDHTIFSQSRELGYFCRNNGGSPTDYMNVSLGVVEFNSEPYSETERDEFVSRRTEVS